jgi:hypothetical protein
MPMFPSLDWCRALADALAKDPDAPRGLKEWNGRSIGVVIGRDKGLAKDFCVYAKPSATKLELEELKVCEDEDDLELEEPDYLFRLPFGTARQLLARQLDPLDVLRRGQVRVEGDLQFLIPLGTKYRGLGERAAEAVPTSFA